MRLPVYRGTQSIGTLEAEREGLYWRLNAVCAGEPLERLWLHTVSHRRCLGPLMPENGLLVCRGRVSCSELGGETITHAVVLASSASDWTLQQNAAVCGRQFKTILRCKDRVAIPWEPGTEFPLPDAFCLCSVAQIDAGWYVTVDSNFADSSE